MRPTILYDLQQLPKVVLFSSPFINKLNDWQLPKVPCESQYCNIHATPFYLSKETPAFNQLIQQVQNIPDEEFTETVNNSQSSIGQRIMFLLDEIIYCINDHYQINNEQGEKLDRIINEIKSIAIDTISQCDTITKKIVKLENDTNQQKKYRTTAEILTPIVRQIRNAMDIHGISESYYSKVIINAFLLRIHGVNLSWEIADFNETYPRVGFNLTIFDQLENIIRNICATSRLNYESLIQ